MNITIKNLRKEQPTEEWQIRVDRQSIWGNPYSMNNQSDVERDRVVELYREHFKEIMKEPLHKAQMWVLLDTYRYYNKLELFCWCSPKHCHADVIKEYLIEQLKELEELNKVRG